MLLQILAILTAVSVVECSMVIDNKIVGGENAKEPYPYKLSMQNSANSHFCGASIISENCILTAAHCVYGKDVANITVLAGVSNLRDASKGSRHPLDSCLVHPNFVKSSTNISNSDIAVCKVKVPFVFGTTIDKLNLSRAAVGAGVNCVLTGWGSISIIRWWPFDFLNNLIYPNELQSATLPTVSNDECKKSFAVDDSQICTFKKMGQGACAGDSGGPLVFDGVLVGIVSYGSYFCATGKCDVFTRVSYFYNWIIANMVLTTFSAVASNSVVNLAIQSAIASLPSAFQDE